MWAAWAEVYPSCPDAFWHQTPRTYNLMMVAANNKRKHEREMSVQHAWLNARLQRIDKMPELNKLIKDMEPKPLKQQKTPQTEEEKNAILMSMLMGFGATLPKAPATPE